MRRIQRNQKVVLQVLTLILAGFSCRAVGAAEERIVPEIYSVGVARREITPDYPIRLSGFGFRREESAGVQAPIYARALAIGSDEQGPSILLTVDSTGISSSIVTEVSKQLAADGIKRERLAITATHTHTAPMLKGILPTLFGQPIPEDHQKRIDRYTKELTDHLVQVARKALKDRQPAQLWWGTGEVDFSKNRRNKETGPVDHRLPVLFVKSPTGALRAVLTSYACHAVTLSHNFIGGDWPGFAAEAIERRHPGVVGMIAIGCGADQNPIPGVQGDKVEIAKSQGLEIAEEVDRVWSNALRPIRGTVTGRLELFQLDLVKLPPRSYWEERVKQGRYIGYHAQVQLDRLNRGEPLQTQIDYSVQTWTFGNDLAFVFLPGEVVVDYALRLNREFDPSRVWVMAYANDTPCYIPSERVLAEGGYEGERAMTYYDKPAKLAPGLEQKIFNAIHKLLPASYKRQKVSGAENNPARKSPSQSLNALHLPAGWSAQVVAAEPLTIDPVAFDFAPDGALWVCEMHDYPSGLKGNFEPGGKIRILRDDNGDGIYDRSTIFLDRLPFPTGVTVWKKGVLICAAPDIIYAEDTNGDDIADIQRVLFSGFGTENYQARVNSLTYGLDGWVYGACGLFGGNIRCQITGETVALGNRDFRIDPDRGILEPVTGRTQQGRVRNDFSDWFGCSNGQPCWYYPILKDDSRPGLQVPPFRISVPTGDARKLYPATGNYQRFKLTGGEGYVTAACGLGIYRDDWLGKELSGNAIVCEPVNLVLHRRVLQSEGLIFRGHRAPEEQESELISSTDLWFRPVQVRTGPDGGLWIADMSRGVIEHPRWIPEDVRNRLEIRAGDDQGRIIRILRRGHNGRPVPKLSEMTPAEWVGVLRSPNGIQRDLAQQLLLWSEDHSTTPALEKLAVSDAAPATRAAAMWILARFGTLTEKTLRQNLSSSHPQLRRQAVRVITEHPELISHPGDLLDLVEEEQDPFVIRELVEAIRVVPISDASGRLARLFKQNHGDRFLQFVILRAVRDSEWEHFVATVLEGTSPSPPLLKPLLSISLANRDAAALRPLLEILLPRNQPVERRYAALVEQVAVAARKEGPRKNSWLNEQAAARLQAETERARKLFAEKGRGEAELLALAGLLTLNQAERNDDVQLLADHLHSQTSPALQLRIISVLSRTADPQVLDLLFEKMPELGPEATMRILEVALSRPESALRLLDKIQKGELAANILNATQRESLRQHPDEQVRRNAETVFRKSDSGSRSAVVARYQQVLSLTGDPKRGENVYRQRCSICHQKNGAGYAVGPDFGELRNKRWSALLNSLLDPNAAVDQRFAVYVIAAKDGRVLQGILAAENGESLTIKGQKAKLTVIARSEIDIFRNTGRSMMPEGLEKELSLQDFADVFALITGRTESGETPSLAPEMIVQKILDDSLSLEERRGYLKRNLSKPAALIQQMTLDLTGNDSTEESRRIPWIWRVAIAAGEKNDTEELRRILRVSLPAVGSSMKNWQAVVLGGGLVNGISKSGDWPHERIAELIGNDTDLRGRWQHALNQAFEMSHQSSVPKGTRYDALRMAAMTGWARSGKLLLQFLTNPKQAELQMGAVSGLVDLPDPPAAEALIKHLPELTPENRQLAIEGLMRNEDRTLSLLKAIQSGQISSEFLGDAIRKQLKESGSPQVRTLAESLFGKSKTASQ